MARVRKSPVAVAPRAARKPKAPPSEPKPRACRECNGHKVFCSKEHPKCKRCRSHSIDCVYEEPEKIKINQETLRALKVKLQRYEEVLSALPPEILQKIPTKSSPITVVGGDEEEDESTKGDDDAEASLSEQLKQLDFYVKGCQGSADNFFRGATKLSGLHGDDASLDQNPAFYDPEALPSRRQDSSHRRPIKLPYIDTARKYFMEQHMYIGTIFAFSDPVIFEQQLQDAYERGPPSPHDTKASLTYAKILSVLALGRLYSVNRRASGDDLFKFRHEFQGLKDEPPGFVYFSHALALLPDVHEEGSILGVETLAYVGYFMQNMNRRDAAFLYIGLALRMAISLGLHLELPASPPPGSTAVMAVKEHEREHRRRVWWSIYSLDRILSLKSGNPVSILDEDISVNMPGRLPGEADDSPVVVLRCYTELSRILGEITALIYRRRTTHTASTLVAAVHSISESLQRWEEALPKRLRLDYDRLSRESMSICLHYYQCINMTARPLLFHVVQKRLAAIRDAGGGAVQEKERDWELGLSQKTIEAIKSCIAAARKTVLVMSKAATHNMVATYGYMDGEHAFSAAIVLALVFGSFPTKPEYTESMTQALALLRRIGELGNSYVAARYQLLIRLQATFVLPSDEVTNVPVSSAEEPAARMEHALLGNTGSLSTDSPLPTYFHQEQPAANLLDNSEQQQELEQNIYPSLFLDDDPSHYAILNDNPPLIDNSNTVFDPMLLEDAESWMDAYSQSTDLFQFLVMSNFLNHQR